MAGRLQHQGRSREPRRRKNRAGIGGWVDVLGTRSSRQLTTGCLRGLEQLEPLSNRNIARVQLACAGIGVNGVGDLVVTALVEASEIKPDFRDVRVYSDRTRIGVKGIAELVDLEVENADRAPKCGVAPISVHGLLVRFVGFVVFLASHVGPTKQVPTLSVCRIGFEAFCEVLDSQFLILEG